MTDPLIPQKLVEFIGQPIVVRQVALELYAALREGRMCRHILSAGPAGTGKSSLGEVLHAELQARWAPVHLEIASGPEYGDATRMRETLWKLARQGQIFVWLIDEIDGISRPASYSLHAVMTHGVFYDSGRAIPMPPFTLYSTSNFSSGVPRALRSRFALRLAFEFYELEDLAKIAVMNAAKLGMELTEEAADFLARNSGGEPRKLNAILRHAKNLSDMVDIAVAREALSVVDLFKDGLSRVQVKELLALAGAEKLTLGLNTLSGILGEDRRDLQLDTEQFLLRRGYLQIVSAGRRLTNLGMNYLSENYLSDLGGGAA